MNRSLRGLAAATAVSALAFAACGGSKDTAAPPPTTKQATKKQAAEVTTVAPEAEPITASEKRWLAQIEVYSERVDDEISRAGAITQAAMRRQARLYLNCERAVSRAGDPGRFEPARPFAERACERLRKAAQLLQESAESSGPGGFVFAGTAEAKQFSRAVSRAFEAAGNGQYDLRRALERAEEIERSFAS